MDTPTIYVAPQGNDAWSGKLPELNAAKIDGPVATLARAVELARQAGSGPRQIIVRGGEYYDTALSLDDRDSGLTIQAAQGETPILYGGRPITGWQQDGQFWSVPLPNKDWDLRMLQVNGRFCPRARYPQEGALTHETLFEEPWMTSTGGGWRRQPTEQELTTMQYKEGDLGDWLDVNNAEITVYHAWDDSMVGVKSIDTEKRIVTFSSPCGHPPGGFGKWLARARTYVVWNIREGMTQPGQWYLDRTAGKVVYWPLPDEDLAQVTAIAPTTERILNIEGRDNTAIHDLTISGLTLSVTNTPLIAASFGAAHMDGALTAYDPLVNCRFVNLTVRNVAGHGIKVRDRVKGDGLDATQKARPSPNQGIRIEGCVTDTTGAGGIGLTAQDSIITQNLVQRVGVMYPAAIGVWFTGDRVEISHNDITDTSYSGIAGHYGEDAQVIYNDISKVMQVLHDGAAIYVFYVKRLMMRGNYSHNIGEEGGNPRHAYYLDEMSEDCDVAENLAVDVPWPFHNHMAPHCRIWGNVAIVHGDAKLTFPRSSDFTLERNVIYATGSITLDRVNAITAFVQNVFYSQTGQVIGIARGDKIGGPQVALETKEIPSTEDTLIEDPLFVDVEHGDYRYQVASPAHRLGIQSLDVSGAGRARR